MNDFTHLPVMPEETLSWLAPAAGETCVDCTLGLGGHSKLIAGKLGPDGHLIGLDRDPAALARARERLADAPCKVTLLRTPFSGVRDALATIGVDRVDRVLLDIGVSSMQFDDPGRGFSFRFDSALDMRMDPDAPRTAADIVNTADEAELADIFYRYGEERRSRAVAKHLVEARAKAPIRTTGELAAAVAEVLPRHGKIHPATQVFQALRIAVNDELGELERVLPAAFSLLRPGGRLALITFHSLEDRLAKNWFRGLADSGLAMLPHRKAILPQYAETRENRRARSAKLRIIEKTDGSAPAPKNKYADKKEKP